jgi:hypothetical protein
VATRHVGGDRHRDHGEVRPEPNDRVRLEVVLVAILDVDADLDPLASFDAVEVKRRHAAGRGNVEEVPRLHRAGRERPCLELDLVERVDCGRHPDVHVRAVRPEQRAGRDRVRRIGCGRVGCPDPGSEQRRQCQTDRTERDFA